MRFRSLKNWENLEQLAGLVFFAQLLEELLFDYSLDTYKPSAMNSSSLCTEALELIEDIDHEVIDQANLSHVLEELVMNLRRDEVVRSMMDFDLETACLKLLNKEVALQEKKVIIQLVRSQIGLTKYKEKVEELLNLAVSNAREKNRIRALTRTYVTTLITMGYSTQYLAASARRIFHWGGKAITKTEDIQLFFNTVKAHKIEYTVVFKASPIFIEISESCAKFDIVITENLGGNIEKHVNDKSFFRDEDEVYLLFERVEALDVFTAREKSERTLERLSALTNIFHHKEVPGWSKGALLVNKDRDHPRIVPSSRNPMHMCVDRKPQDAAGRLYSFIDNFTLTEKDSFQKFTRAVELHGLALGSDSPENQLLNLWVALETMTPSKLSRNKAKVNNIIDSTLPFLSLNYIDLLTDRFLQDLRLWSRKKANEALTGIQGRDDREKVVRLLVLPNHEEERSSLYATLGDFHLLRNRAHYFAEALSSTDKIRRILDSHWVRVGWQIRRIYRARNQIVHAGHTPNYISVLIKNIHDYLDTIINEIAQLASTADKVNTIDQAYTYINISHDQYLKSLKSESVAITSENIEHYIFRRRA